MNSLANDKTHIVIYAYSYPSSAPSLDKIKIKLGDTTQGINDGKTAVECAWIRMNQQGDTSESASKNLVKAWMIERTSSLSRDHDLHKLFKKDGRLVCEGGKGQEWFYFTHSTDNSAAISEIESYINHLIGKSPRKVLNLRTFQKRKLQEALAIIAKFANGELKGDACNIIAYLCPRFGKTIWALELFRRVNRIYGNDVMILPAYWLSAHTSFQNEVGQYEEFRNMEFIDSSKDYSQQLSAARDSGKLVVISLSMCVTDFCHLTAIRNIPNYKKIEFIDEGDFGAWTNKSTKVVDYIWPIYNYSSLLKPNPMGIPIRINASGTNLQRLAKGQRGKTHAVIQVAYPQLERTEKDFVKRSFYKMKLNDNIINIAQYLENKGNFSWSRMWANATASANIGKSILRAMFAEDDKYVEMSLYRILDKTPEVVMFWASADNAELKRFGELARCELKQYNIVVLCGSEENELITNNKNAEDIVKIAIQSAKNAGKKGVVIISNSMGSRSFSIPELEATILCYDRGSLAATNQKGLRSCTPGKLYSGLQKTTGFIISLSIDPNRDDKITELLIDEACIITEEEKISFTESLRNWVLNSVNVFRSNEVGNYVKISQEEIIDELQDNENLLRVADISVDIEEILANDKILAILGAVKSTNGNKKDKKEPLLKNAKTFVKNRTNSKSNKKNQKDPELKKIQDIINLALHSLNRTATTVAELAGCDSKVGYRGCLTEISNDVLLNTEFHEVYGIDSIQAIELMDEGFLKKHLLDIVVQNSIIDGKKESDELWK